MHSCNAGAMNINRREPASNELEYINLVMGITILNMHDIWYSDLLSTPRLMFCVYEAFYLFLCDCDVLQTVIFSDILIHIYTCVPKVCNFFSFFSYIFH